MERAAPARVPPGGTEIRCRSPSAALVFLLQGAPFPRPLFFSPPAPRGDHPLRRTVSRSRRGARAPGRAPAPDPGGATRPPTRGPRRGSSPGGGRPGREGPMKFSAAFPACPGGRPVPGGGHRNPSTAGSRRGAPRASVVRAPRPRDRRTWPPRVSAHKGGSHRERGPSRGMCPKKAVSEAAQTDGGDK